MQRLGDQDQVHRIWIDSTRFRPCDPVADARMWLRTFDLLRARIRRGYLGEMLSQPDRRLPVPSRAIPRQFAL